MKRIYFWFRKNRWTVIPGMAMVGVAVLAVFSCGEGKKINTDSDPDIFDLALWKNPPAQFRPCFRWWWPGGSVSEDELRRELKLFRDQGFGCVEIQPFAYGLTPVDLASDPEIKTVGSDSFFRKVGAACRIARELGLTVDLTFGSSWPSGGPFIREGRERQLLISSRDLSGPVFYTGPVPPVIKPKYQGVLELMMNAMAPFTGEAELVAVAAARVVDPGRVPVEIGEMMDLSGSLSGSQLSWSVPAGDWILFAFYENGTGQLVINPAYPETLTEALILDHLDRRGLEEMITGFGEPLVAHLEDYLGNTLQSVFVDSFELVGELPWTAGFLDIFATRIGYDLRPYLPLLFREYGEVKWLEAAGPSSNLYSAGAVGERVREDYEKARGELFRDRFVLPFLEWAHAHNLQVRLQNHGGFEDFLEGYELVDIPESEGLYAGGSYDFLKLASSAAHTAGKRYASSETFVAMVQDSRGLTRDDFYLLAGRALSAGINKIIHHGFPYLYHRRDGSRWFPFDGAYAPTLGMSSTFSSCSDETHPVWTDFPGLNAYIARLAYAFSRGKPRSEIAWLYPERAFPDLIATSSQGFSAGQGDSPVTAALKVAGLTYDRVNRDRLTGAVTANGRLKIGAAEYSGLLVTDLKTASPELLETMEAVSRAGIPVVVLGGLPARAPGWGNHEACDHEVAVIAGRLAEEVTEVAAPDELGGVFSSAGVSSPVLTAEGRLPFLLNRRVLREGEILLLFNESNQDLAENITLAIPGRKASILDPQSGEKAGEHTEKDSLGHFSFQIRIPSRRAVVIWVEK
ncbi:MAG: glycosyl hydrolase [Proteobacteria bacterium]|nr:glycosyl hydrolase [Pseudomonadota bacterium]